MLSKFSFLQRGQRQSEGDGEEGEALIDSTPSFHSNHGKIEILDKNSFFFSIQTESKSVLRDFHGSLGSSWDDVGF